MLAKGTKVEMTKGYRGVKGTIEGITDSLYEFYVITLDNGINIVGGPASFVVEEDTVNS